MLLSDPSMGALPQEWLDPSRINFRTRTISGLHSDSRSVDDTHPEVGFCSTESNTV
uniref:Uncharacterized protein n=1 Tax=Loa loa TaxID=7209 RepID=A0A1I7W4A6_LOALO